MATSKPSGLARFTRQGAAPPTATLPSATSKPTDEASAAAAGLTAPLADATGPAARTPRSREAGKAKLVGVYLMPDGHRQLKIEAARRGVTISDLVREAVNAWFTNEHLPPLA